MNITRKSIITGTTHTREIAVDPIDMDTWQHGGGPIEETMPYLSVYDREFILSGIMPGEWDAAFRESADVAF